MKALVYHGPGKKAWEEVDKPAFGTTPTQSCASMPPRSAAPISTSSKAISRQSPTDASSATKRSARSSRSARASRPSGPATASSCRA